MVRFTRRTALAGTLAAAALLAVGLSASQASASESDLPVLTIVGKIDASGEGKPVELDLKELEALGTVVVETNTPWHDGVTVFEGVPMSALMEHVGAFGDEVDAIALNDYSAVIPLSDFDAYNAILATKTNGQYMSVRNKGPFFIIYPYDSRAELSNQKYYARSVWQLTKLVVE